MNTETRDEWIGVAEVAADLNLPVRVAWELVKRLRVPMLPGLNTMARARFKRADWAEALERSKAPAISPRSTDLPGQLTFLSGEPPANPSPSLASEEEWLTLAATWRSNFFDWLAACAPLGWCGRTSPASCHPTADGTLEPSSGAWSNSGMGSPTECWTLSTSEFPSDGAASSLSDILETGDVPSRFYLSGRACRGILRRAERRGRALPSALRRALETTGDTTDRATTPTM
jgi:hypothetical protein